MVVSGTTAQKNLEDQDMYEETRIHAYSGLLYFTFIFGGKGMEKENRVCMF